MQLIFLQHFKRTTALTALLALGLMFLLISGCSSGTPGSPTPTVTLTVTPTLPPTLTPTPVPLGNTENPFVLGLVSPEENPQMVAAGDALSQRIWEISGKMAVAEVYPSYAALLDAMAAGRVHITWMPPLTYLYASQRGIAEVILLTNHFGVYQYGAQFLANVESQFTPYFDPISGMSSADAATALAQFQDLRPCWVEPQSASGYILPAGIMAVNAFPLAPAVMVQNHTAVVRALYIKGICDFGATFSISGDPRTASAVQDDLPDVMDRILVIWRTDAVIPNLNLSLLAGITESDRQMLVSVFEEIARSSEGKGILTLSANYEIEDLQPVQDELYNPLREMVRVLGLNLREMIGK